MPREEQVPASPVPPVSPDPPGVTTAGGDAASISTQSRKNRSKLRKDEKDPCGNPEKSLCRPDVGDHVIKNLSNLTGGAKIQRGKSETNGNYQLQPPGNLREARSEEAMKAVKKRRPVTVDSAKAKTSLEALKLSIKQLKWKEVCKTPKQNIFSVQHWHWCFL